MERSQSAVTHRLNEPGMLPPDALWPRLTDTGKSVISHSSTLLLLCRTETRDEQLRWKDEALLLFRQEVENVSQSSDGKESVCSTNPVAAAGCMCALRPREQPKSQESSALNHCDLKLHEATVCSASIVYLLASWSEGAKVVTTLLNVLTRCNMFTHDIFKTRLWQQKFDNEVRIWFWLTCL